MACDADRGARDPAAAVQMLGKAGTAETTATVAGKQQPPSPVTKLPTAATSYIQVRRYGRQWSVLLVTPVEGARPISTKLGSTPSETAAVDYARHVGAQMQRPVRLPGEARP